MCLLSPPHKQRMVSATFFSSSYSSLSICCGSNEKNLHEICLKHSHLLEEWIQSLIGTLRYDNGDSREIVV